MDEARRNKPIIADREIVVLAGLKPFARGLHPPQTGGGRVQTSIDADHRMMRPPDGDGKKTK